MISATTPDNGRHSIDGARRNAPVSTHTHPIYEFKKFFFQTAALWLKTKKENKEDPQRTVLDIYQKKNLLLLLQPAMKMSHKSLYPPRISKVNYDFFSSLLFFSLGPARRKRMPSARYFQSNQPQAGLSFLFIIFWENHEIWCKEEFFQRDRWVAERENESMTDKSRCRASVCVTGIFNNQSGPNTDGRTDKLGHLF